MLLALVLLAQAADPAEKFQKVFNKTPEQVVDLVGPPAAKYIDDDRTCWLYDVPSADKEGRRTCPEVVFKKGKCTQTNRLTEEVMKKAITAANKFKDWTPPAEVKEKDFFLADTNLVGKSKAEVTAKLGGPDGKRVFNGVEIWVYRKVRATKDNPMQFTILVEFENEKVTRTVGS